jgi:hypothetical protein
MTDNVQIRLEGSTLIVRIPMRFQRRGGRKRIVAPDGSEITPTTKPRPDGTLVKALARAWRWQRMLENGEHGPLAEVADAERISRSYVSRILRLTFLAPDLIERIPTDARRQDSRSSYGRSRSSGRGNANGSLRAALRAARAAKTASVHASASEFEKGLFQSNRRIDAPGRPINDPASAYRAMVGAQDRYH